MENNCNFVCSRGILKSCDFFSQNPISSWSCDAEYLNNMISDNKMFDGMSIYVCTDALPHFIENVLPNISKKFTLVTGDSDATVPEGTIDLWHNPRPLETAKCLELANNDNLIKWFSQNCILNHEKIEQLPIGLDYHTISNDPNKPWRAENEGTSPQEQEEILNSVKNDAKPFYDRICKIYVNFTVDIKNDKSERTVAINSISQELIHLDIEFKPRTNIWKNAREYAFVLSPSGGGLDCHRTWEALCLGCIPIVKSMGTNKMYEGLPVLVVNEWRDVTQELLNDVISNFKETVFNYDKLTLKYWINKFSQHKDENKNPFELNVKDSMSYTNDELREIQKQLENKRDEVINLIKEMHPKNDENYKITIDDMVNRCSKSVFQKLIDVENDIYPTKALYKIGNGGNNKNCFVCCTPLSNDRDARSKNIHQSLEKVGFNGHFYLFNGGFPNPNGIEMKYAAVPYCFKIFMMVEAKKLGFEKVIWLDSACYAVNNPDRLFDILESDDAIFRQFWPYTPGFLTYENTVYKETIKTLNSVTGGNLVNNINVCTIVFGLNFNSEKINRFVDEYYNMVKIGTPFLSYYPEEVVITAIFNKPEYNYVFYNREESHRLFIHDAYTHNNYDNPKHWGFYFVQRPY